MNWTAFFTYLVARLSEPSTYRGLTLMLAGSAFYIDPARVDAIVLASSVVLGAIEAGKKG